MLNNMWKVFELKLNFKFANCLLLNIPNLKHKLWNSFKSKTFYLLSYLTDVKVLAMIGLKHNPNYNLFGTILYTPLLCYTFYPIVVYVLSYYDGI